MTPAGTTRLWLAVIFGISLVPVLAWTLWHGHKPISLRGAVLVQDADLRKQLPIANVQITAEDDLALSASTSDSSGFFTVDLQKRIRRGHHIVLHFTHPRYRPLTIEDFVQDKLYIAHMVPIADQVSPQGQPPVRVTNVRVRFTVQVMTELNVGSAVKTFEIQNKGNIPCKGQHPCSPDGRWKATLGSGSLDAGPGKEFRDARISCIAGPCPFTRIEADPRGGQIITASVRNWSDTTTFLLEAEVSRRMVSQIEHWSYPILFGDRLSFTLPADAESVSIEADLDGQTIIFPIGPSLFLSWATCDRGSQGNARVYRCELKPGYRL